METNNSNNIRITKLFIIFSISLLLLSACNLIKPQQGNGPCNEGQNQLAINQIQGPGHLSPFDGEDVRCVTGIVTAVNSNGFFMQSTKADNDEKTSEALFVNLLTVADVKPGDEVMVNTGEIREYNPAGLGENSLTTTSLRTNDIEVISSGNALPTALVLGEGGRVIPDKVIENDVNGVIGEDKGKFDPDEDGMDFYESMEGMLVQINNALVVSANNSYNELVVLADLGKNASGLNSSGILLLSEDDPNPERLILDDKYIKMPELYPGDVFTSSIIGILEYDFGNYRIQPIETPVYKSNGLTEGLLAVEPIELTESQISVVSMNTENLSHLEDQEGIEDYAEMIVDKLSSPDIMILQEIMDDDGYLDSAIVSADENINALQDAVEEAGGPTYRWFNVNPVRNQDGGADGANIRTIIMFRMDRGLKFLSALPAESNEEVRVNGSEKNTALSNNPGLIYPSDNAFRNSRKPIIAQFQYQDEIFYVIGLHLSSKGPDGPLFGAIQPPNLSSEEQRIAQASVVNSFIKEILEKDPTARIIVAGDLNDFPWSETIQTLKGNELVNLWEDLDRGSWFSYIYEGNGEVLDHIMVSEAFAQHVNTFKPIHLNSVLPASNQLSDHDPILTIIDFNYYE
ncbi:MAG: endonuclease/exonuclease/phosphatase family protein [Anaerolineaceae bacterium]|nr:endonuclease/exonuclease/phosphatase family protein [Anaerolineaceae bacterium]